MRNVDGDTDVDDPSKLIAYFRVQSCDFIQAIIKFTHMLFTLLCLNQISNFYQAAQRYKCDKENPQNVSKSCTSTSTYVSIV